MVGAIHGKLHPANSRMSNSSLGDVAQKILQDALSSITHDIVSAQHREHKRLLVSLDPTTKLPHCESCRLPRLLDPPLAPKVRGATSDPPPSTNYCDRKTWSRRPGHDIYGNPFLKSDVTGRPLTKKEREAQKNSKKDDGTPVSENADADGTGPPSPTEEAETKDKGKLEKGEKKASKIDEKLRKGEYVPWHTCPSCKRSLLITRFAKHLEQCMGLSGRAASRNALAKINGTPAGSRGATPNPSQEGSKDNDEEEGDLGAKGNGGVRKKLLKKGLKDKAKKEKPNGKLPKSLAAKRPPSQTNRSSPAPSSVGDGKRDRDELGDDDDEVHVKKRQKLQRVGSTVSILSQSTTAPDMERQESNDGSFVNEESFADE
ncbi:hypothetical protein DOTSEDRAFT_68781 [Dothistroma septosporum NZE10]|uniref:SAGA-associated factor 11 n=1 Tax=Dothistroma septosporum (strain NZE10 / CBS 128990) TaxID=675120 RepID=N1Q501_DOTSN|nr:hypothetical protein DOTSEDRAFT_68781 [Dothistroma septosporum NZE10]